MFILMEEEYIRDPYGPCEYEQGRNNRSVPTCEMDSPSCPVCRRRSKIQVSPNTDSNAMGYPCSGGLLTILEEDEEYLRIQLFDVNAGFRKLSDRRIPWHETSWEICLAISEFKEATKEIQTQVQQEMKL